MAAPDLTHLAGSAARYFGGWTLLLDAGTLTRRGPGQLFLDLLHGSCRHGNLWVPRLGIQGALYARVGSALAAVDASWADLTRAEVLATLRFHEQAAVSGPMAGWSGYDGIFLRCHMDITSTFATPDGTWSGRHDATLTWPRAWAETR